MMDLASQYSSLTLPAMARSLGRIVVTMAWIKTIPLAQVEGRLAELLQKQRSLYPIEYATPVSPSPDPGGGSIVQSHTLMPDAMFHAFAAFGAMMAPDLPLSRRQHEMIATVVSATNSCHY
jgi:alkylhydroperoxidase family enzyme